MNVVISAGGRFHAIKLAQQLHQRNSLLKLFSFSYTVQDHANLPPHLVHNISSCALLDKAFAKLRLAHIINASQFNHLKDNLFDYLVSKQLRKLPAFDIFVGWAHYAEQSIPIARAKGALVIIESGSSHILEQQYLLEEEYKKWGVAFAPIHQKVVEKMVREYELADYIMTLSTASKQSFIKHGIPTQKVLQMPCGVDVEYFLNNAGRSLPPLPKFRIIFVGLINIRKGIPYLLDAWNQANLPDGTTELVLVGTMQKDMAQLLPKLSIPKNVIFYGPTNRETLKKLYQQSSVFVLPSVEDGFGMVMGEAMACGLPIICTTNTGAPDIIKNGKEGWLVPPQNSSALAEKITWCYEHKNDCFLMGQKGQGRIQDFTWDAYGETVVNVYQKILREKTGKS